MKSVNFKSLNLFLIQAFLVLNLSAMDTETNEKINVTNISKLGGGFRDEKKAVESENSSGILETLKSHKKSIVTAIVTAIAIGLLIKKKKESKKSEKSTIKPKEHFFLGDEAW